MINYIIHYPATNVTCASCGAGQAAYGWYVGASLLKFAAGNLTVNNKCTAKPKQLAKRDQTKKLSGATDNSVEHYSMESS